MIKKIKALLKFEISVVKDNKMVFIYSLVMPMAYLLVTTLSSHANHIPVEKQLGSLLPIVGYVAITGVLNGWVIGILTMRENNFLKTFTSIVGDKRYIFISNFIFGLAINCVQILIIILAYQIITNSLSARVVAISFITFLIMDVIVSLASSIVLIWKMKFSTIPMILTSYILLGIYLVNIQPEQIFTRILFNMINMYSLTLDVGRLISHINNVSYFSLSVVVVPVIFISTLGISLINKIPVSSIHTRA